MMFPIRSIAYILAAIVLAAISSTTLQAQSYEEQAKTILKLYESGQQDTAYALIEPLKKTARFIPAAVFVRAQMTPDDRALPLYREVIALEPGGSWADDAAYQLIARYIDKRDSLGAYTWVAMLKTNYPRSPFINMANDKLGEIGDWRLPVDDHMAGQQGGTDTSETFHSPTKTFRGYALQVGLFPTLEAAQKRSDELAKKKNLRTTPIAKQVEGKEQYALVVGPYDTIEDANAKKAEVLKACSCQAFTVKVE